jgi:hypothetical protein
LDAQVLVQQARAAGVVEDIVSRLILYFFYSLRNTSIIYSHHLLLLVHLVEVHLNTRHQVQLVMMPLVLLVSEVPQVLMLV